MTYPHVPDPPAQPSLIASPAPADAPVTQERREYEARIRRMYGEAYRSAILKYEKEGENEQR